MPVRGGVPVRVECPSGGAKHHTASPETLPWGCSSQLLSQIVHTGLNEPCCGFRVIVPLRVTELGPRRGSESSDGPHKRQTTWVETHSLVHHSEEIKVVLEGPRSVLIRGSVPLSGFLSHLSHMLPPHNAIHHEVLSRAKPKLAPCPQTSSTMS